MNRIREHAPKSRQALRAALGLPLVWFLLYCMVGPSFPSEPPYPANNRFLHTAFIFVGVPLWFVAFGLLHRARTELDGAGARAFAFHLVALFAFVLCIGFLARRFL